MLEDLDSDPGSMAPGTALLTTCTSQPHDLYKLWTDVHSTLAALRV